MTINEPRASRGRGPSRSTASQVPAGTTAYDYLDVFAHGSFGTVSMTDPSELRASGSSWSSDRRARRRSRAPAAGRFLQGFVRVSERRTARILGSAEVRLKNVGP